jgi:hypothetical protein
MKATTTGEFRLLSDPRRGETVTLVDREEFEPTTVAADGYDGDLADRVAALRPGYVVSATLAWTDGDARFEDATVETPTLYTFREGVSGLFEDALDTMEEARREGLGVNSRVTYDADRRPNGAVYAFAEQPGERDVFAEFRSGARPLDPLLARAAEESPEPHDVFVFRPATHQFVLVYVVLEKGSLLAGTVRDTYDCPRPDEPLSG